MSRAKTQQPPAGKPVRFAENPDARRRAAQILEVLAGLRTPAQAAEVLGLRVVRYYALERRAVAGMVAALDPKDRRQRRSQRRELSERDRQIHDLSRENTRLAALLRAAQRGVCVEPGKPPGKAPPGGQPTRRPRARALTLARTLSKVAPVAQAAEPRKEAAHG